MLLTAIALGPSSSCSLSTRFCPSMGALLSKDQTPHWFSNGYAPQ
jgi:hypothetical protein